MKKKPKFKLTSFDPSLLDLIQSADQKTAGRWALNCAKRVLPYFSDRYPGDQRPQEALEALQDWIRTSAFSMRAIRAAALASHAAAREVGEDSPARSAARAAGQAVSTAHVRTHAIATSAYALQAIHRAAEPEEFERRVAQEGDWQKRCLEELMGGESVDV